jgi:predicted nucleotidyltransferase
MSRKPSTAEGYSDTSLELIKSTCLQIATVLGDFMDDLVIVGGLVPSLIIDQITVEPHVGTLDLDVGMSLAIFDNQLYQEITGRLRNTGFKPDTNDKGKQVVQRWIHPDFQSITIDFLIPPSLENDKGGTIRNLENDFGAIIVPGLKLAFQDFEIVEITGKTLKGEKASRRVKVCGPGAYVVLKSLAFMSRGENKDAYDLYYLIRNYGKGVEDVAERFIKLLPDENCEKAIEILKDNFTELESVGVLRAVRFLIGENETDEAKQTEVVGFVEGFLNAIV